MPIKIATWNVNSLRVRMPHLLTWIAEDQPDIIALQETKTENKNFPINELVETGYQLAFNGQKTYNGVAILSRQSITDIEIGFPTFEDSQARVLAATINDIRVINLYVPNGSSVGSDKYIYKLDWLAHLDKYIKQQLAKYSNLIALGDFNIAPEDRDVHDPKLWEGNVLVSPAERAALRAIMSNGLHDTFRIFNEEPGHYSWWDYRAAGFRRNLGLRIDHLLISENLKKRCQECFINKTPRTWERPSDHTPVVAIFHP